MSIVNDTPTVVLLLVASLVIGCIFGSFLNVVIWRVPNHISLVNPKRSFCPNCEAPIAWYDNIPIISWLVLGAKCRHCKEPIAVRYPIVEALGGLSFLAVTLGGSIRRVFAMDIAGTLRIRSGFDRDRIH